MTTPKEDQKHTDLLPCPFCGSSDCEITQEDIGTGSSDSAGYSAHCNDCNAEGPIGFEANKRGRQDHAASEAWAATQWNTRKADCHEELVYAVKVARNDIIAVLCDPENEPCFHGSDGDRAIIRNILKVCDRALAFANLSQEICDE